MVGASVTSTRGKLEILKQHYEQLGEMSVDSEFDDDWRGDIENKVSDCNKKSKEYEDNFLDKEIGKMEILRCIRKLRNNKIGGSDGMVGELLTYGGMGIVDSL